MGNVVDYSPSVRIIHDEDLRTLLRSAAMEGAKEALAQVGLGDACAADDMRDMRDWLSAWRTAKKQALETTMSFFTKSILVVFFIGLMAVVAKFGLKVPQ